MAMVVAMGGRDGGGVPRRRGLTGEAVRQPGGQGGWPVPGRAAAARGLVQSGPAAAFCRRWREKGR